MTYTFDATDLDWFDEATVPGRVVAISFDVEHTAGAFAEGTFDEPEGPLTDDTFVTSLSEEYIGIVTFAACVAEMTVEVTYYIDDPEAAGGVAPSCSITESFEGVTDFEVLPPDVHLDAHTCSGGGLEPR